MLQTRQMEQTSTMMNNLQTGQERITGIMVDGVTAMQRVLAHTAAG
jgi:hypothetical protein